MRLQEQPAPTPEPEHDPAAPVMLQLKPAHEIRDGPVCEIADKPRGDTHGDAIRRVA